MPVQIRVDGVGQWTTEDYTLDEMVAAELRTKMTWAYLVGSAHVEAESVRTLVIQWLVRTTPDLDAAAKQAGALTNRQVMVTKLEEDDRPVQWEDGLPVVDPKAAEDGTGTT